MKRYNENQWLEIENNFSELFKLDVYMFISKDTKNHKTMYFDFYDFERYLQQNNDYPKERILQHDYLDAYISRTYGGVALHFLEKNFIDKFQIDFFN